MNKTSLQLSLVAFALAATFVCSTRTAFGGGDGTDPKSTRHYVLNSVTNSNMINFGGDGTGPKSGGDGTDPKLT